MHNATNTSRWSISCCTLSLALVSRFSERAFEAPYESKGKGPVMSYEKFVQLLDPEDPVAQKAVDIIVKDVFTRARNKRQAIEEARNYHTSSQPSYSSIAAAAAARRNQAGSAEARRVWPAQAPSLSQRLHGWRYLQADDPDRHQQHVPSAEDTAEYDAIIADAQRQVASPLPMLGLPAGGSGGTHLGEDMSDQWFSNIQWPELNATYAEQPVTTWSDDEDSDIEEHRSRIRAVERALAAVQTQRDNARTNLTRLSTIQGNGTTPSAASTSTSSATRMRILQRLEERRRHLMERAEEQRAGTSSNRAYPSYFNTSFSRTSTENLEREPLIPNEFPSTPIPIIMGGDFSNLPTASGGTNTRADGNETVRASYGPLQRNNSIRRSGFHAARSSQSSPPNATAALSAANALLPRTSQRPLTIFQPRSPLSITDPSLESVETASVAARRQDLDTLFGRRSSEAPLDAETTAAHADEVSSFEDFSRASRQASRNTRENEEESDSREHANGAANASSTNILPQFRFTASSDPMLASGPADADAVTELLGSSSSVAGLGSLGNASSLSLTSPSSSRAPYISNEGRRSIVPPRAPILSRRSFPLDSPPVATASHDVTGSTTNPTQPTTVTRARSLGGSPPQRSSSVPERGQLYRREEILSLAQFLNEDTLQVLRNENEDGNDN